MIFLRYYSLALLFLLFASSGLASEKGECRLSDLKSGPILRSDCVRIFEVDEETRFLIQLSVGERDLAFEVELRLEDHFARRVSFDGSYIRELFADRRTYLPFKTVKLAEREMTRLREDLERLIAGGEGRVILRDFDPYIVFRRGPMARILIINEKRLNWSGPEGSDPQSFSSFFLGEVVGSVVPASIAHLKGDFPGAVIILTVGAVGGSVLARFVYEPLVLERYRRLRGEHLIRGAVTGLAAGGICAAVLALVR